MKINYKDLEKRLIRKIKDKIKYITEENVFLEDYSKKKENGVD